MATSRGPVLGGVVLLGLALVVLVSGGPADHDAPLDPRSDAPHGTSALVALLEGLGAHVELSSGPPSREDDIALVLTDHLDEDQTGDLEAWVRGGGQLVVTDPSSSLVPPVVDQEDVTDPDVLEPGYCTLETLDDVETVDGGAAVRYDTFGSSASCFGSASAAFVLLRQLGMGDTVAVGGAAFLTNDILDEADNAVLAAALLAPTPGITVRIVDAPLPAGGGDESLADLIGGGVRRAALQLGVAFVLYAVWRAIRLGRPVAEDQTVEIAGSELVGAAGRLLERGKAPGAAAEVLREGLRRTLRARLGVPRDASSSVLVDVVAQRTGADPEAVRLAVGDDPVTTDAELVSVASAVASVHQEVFQP